MNTLCHSYQFACRLWIFLPIEYFPLTYDLNDLKSTVNSHLLTVCSLLPACFILFALHFLVTPCLIVAIQPPYMEGISIKYLISLSIYLLSTYLPTYLPIYLSTYLPAMYFGISHIFISGIYILLKQKAENLYIVNLYIFIRAVF